jgi:MoaA/NifB/PqqE/SkfB family radical SAM enzyme
MSGARESMITSTAPQNDRKGNGLILDGTKVAWHQERVAAWLKGERIAPITIDMALTRACNYKCDYCYGVLQENPRSALTREILFNFLDDAAEIGVKGISLVSDGESTLSPHFADFIEKGHANGLSMAVGTNGYLLDEEKLERILPRLTYLRFNLSAAEARRYSEIHGVPESFFQVVCKNIANAVRIKHEKKLDVTIGMQMVLKPEYADQILPLACLGQELQPDYLVIKHCSDDESGSLNVDYSRYKGLFDTLTEAEKLSTADYVVSVKWSKIGAEGKRTYAQCYGPPFILQMSGSGLVAPCGMLFGTRYSHYWIGNIAQTRFKELWQSDKYWAVMNEIASPAFDAHTMCGCLCLQHKVNEYLWELKQNGQQPDKPAGSQPMHINFI